MNTKPTQDEINKAELARQRKKLLYERGYTIASAARHLKCSKAHFWYVLNGDRESQSLLDRIAALPQRDLILRERLTPAH